MDAFTEHYRSNVNNELVPKIVCSLCTQLYCVEATLWRLLPFPLKSFYCLDRPLEDEKKKDEKT